MVTAVTRPIGFLLMWRLPDNGGTAPVVLTAELESADRHEFRTNSKRSTYALRRKRSADLRANAGSEYAHQQLPEGGLRRCKPSIVIKVGLPNSRTQLRSSVPFGSLCQFRSFLTAAAERDRVGIGTSLDHWIFGLNAGRQRSWKKQ